MRVGFCVEGSTDKWLLHGLRERWCPEAELVEGRYRGAFRRREIPKACFELYTKGVDLIILLRDANAENWRHVHKDDLKACDEQHAAIVVVGVCDRNVECWLVADAQYAASKLGLSEAEWHIDDPKKLVEKAMGITRLDDKRDEIMKYVSAAPLHRWLHNASFEHFYDALWQMSKRLQCTLENLRDASHR